MENTYAGMSREDFNDCVTHAVKQIDADGDILKQLKNERVWLIILDDKSDIDRIKALEERILWIEYEKEVDREATRSL